ncbi:MAG: hypothetical protein HPY55_11565 [Firmicutes bacterium]|nr:hypothetical protein [Bacillota bacterium]
MSDVDLERLPGMRAGVAREAAERAGFTVVERVTRPPWGVRGDLEARVLRVRRTGPATIEVVIAYEQHLLQDSQKPPL